eukprot:6188456-Pleurochrysis_carterae.AAC.6
MNGLASPQRDCEAVLWELQLDDSREPTACHLLRWTSVSNHGRADAKWVAAARNGQATQDSYCNDANSQFGMLNDIDSRTLMRVEGLRSTTSPRQLQLKRDSSSGMRS